MHLAALLLASALPLGAQFVRIEVAFQDTGCASCIESLEGRLSRVRGVERVELDAAQGLVTLHLAAENRVRLTPLLSRITQDGTRILRTGVAARGTIIASEEGYALQLAQPVQTFRLQLGKDLLQGKPRADLIYKITAVVSGTQRGEELLLKVESISCDG
jgi:hypothetical protein